MTELLQAHTLLMVPSKDLRGMLDEGPCGFRPPIASRYRCRDTRRWRWLPGRHVDAPSLARVDEDSGGGLSGPYALVFRWEGEWMPHGWLAAHASGKPSWPTVPAPSYRLEFLGRLQEAGCTLVALDEQGKEMNHD